MASINEIYANRNQEEPFASEETQVVPEKPPVKWLTNVPMVPKPNEIIQQIIPKEKPPTDQQLSIFEEWKKFQPDAEKYAKEKHGDPEQAATMASQRVVDYYKNSMDDADRALMKPEQKRSILDHIDLVGQQERTRVQKLLDDEMTVARYAFEKTISQKEERAKELRTQAAKTPNLNESAIRALTEKLGRAPTEQEKTAEMIRVNAQAAGAKAKENELAKSEGGFKDWTPEAKAQTFSYNLITGKPPVNAAGLGGNDRKQYGKEYAQWQVDRGVRPSDIALMQADYRAGDMSLKNMTKQEAPMSAFVGNINKQISKVEELYTKNDRLGLRLVDLPIRELRVRAKGSGDEAVKASYLLEISNEIGKLSSGSSASIQQLSDSAKEDWKKVHDVNLSFKEIMKVVNATRDQANMRMQSWRDAKQEVRDQLRSIGVEEKTNIPNKPKFTIIKVR